MSQRLREISPYLSVVGFVLLLAGLAVHTNPSLRDQLPDGFDMLGIALAVLGAALVLVWPIVNPSALRALLGSRQTRYGGNALLLAVSVLGILAALNFLGTRYYRIWDLTANQRFSISNQTTQILNDLDQRGVPVQLNAIVDLNEPPDTLQELEQLVAQYRQRLPGLKYEVIRTPIDALKIQQLEGRTGEPPPGRGLVAEAGGNHAVVFSFDEQSLTEAIVKATREEEKRVLFTAGHGEHDPTTSGADGRGYAGARSGLEREGYAVEAVNLATMTETLDADAIIVAGPQRPFADEEVALLADYLEGGGSIMLMIDPQVDAGLGGLLAPYVIRPRDDLVLDPARALAGSASLPVIERDGYGFHEVTRDLEAFSSIMPSARSIEVGDSPLEGVQTTVLLETSDQAWGEQDLAALADPQARPEPDGPDVRGPLTLAVAAEIGAAGDDDDAPAGRLVVFGTSAFAADAFLQQVRGSANLDLFLNGVNWLTLDEVLLGIGPKAPDERPLEPPQSPWLLFLSTVVLAPLAVLATGAWLYWQRR